ncbi:MAG: TadE/TadG family type IV pilus assembly protein [Bacilli bacterium]
MNRKGQALVEFVLILPLFIFIIFTVVDFGMILSKKSELENISADISKVVKNESDIEKVKKLYPDLDIVVKEDNEYINIEVEDDVDILTPGLNLILGDPYRVTVKRTIFNDKNE